MTIRLLSITLLMATVVSAQSAGTAPSQSASSSNNADEILSFMAGLSQSTADQNEDKDHLSSTVRFSEMYDSNPLGAEKRPRNDEISSFSGSLALSKHWRRSALTASYTGGADYYLRFDGQNSSYHEVNGAESFTFGRAKLQLGGNYQFLPASSFGFDATHQISDASYALINPELVPNQSIQTQPLSRQSYTGVTQLELKLTDRSAIDFSGSYGRLRYQKNEIPGTDQASAGAGYAFALSSRDSIGLSYQYALYQTIGDPLQVIDSVMSASYAHRFGQNLVLKFGAGPDLRTYAGSTEKSLKGIDPSVSANSQLDYSSGNTHLNLAYSRATVAGQGVLQGSDSDQIQLAASRALGRGFAMNGSFGYSRSTSLARVAKTRKLVDQVVNSDYFSAGLSKRMGSFVAVVLGYTLQTQNSNAPICAGGLCQVYPVHHVVTFGFTFSPKPLNLGKLSSM